VKIVLTTPYNLVPANYGGAVRTIELANALRSQGHDVAILSANNALADNFAFRSRHPLNYFFNFSFASALRHLAVEFSPDLVVCAFPYQAAMLLSFSRKYGVPLVYDAHNIEHLRFERLGKPVLAKFVRFFERALIRHSKAVICVSEEEQNYLQARYSKPILLIPNGVNLENSTPGTERKYTFCFFGALDYQPNSRALAFIRESWPSLQAGWPEATLLLVGRNPPSWSHTMEGWVVTGEVDNVSAAISQAKILLCPVSEGGGSRLKIVEAVANGLLVVSTRFGAEGFEKLISGGAVLISPLESFVTKVLTLVNREVDPEEVAKTAAPYDWKVLVGKLESLDVSAREE
jgi:glycosyltransferase involved in cell wall biosynthesis